MGFIQIIDEDEEILQLILRRRSRLIAKYLQRQRITMKRIETGRTVDFTTYVGLWFNDYPELQFQKDLRFTKTAFRVYKHWNQLRSLLYQFLSFQRLVEITSPAIMGGIPPNTSPSLFPFFPSSLTTFTFNTQQANTILRPDSFFPDQKELGSFL